MEYKEIVKKTLQVLNENKEWNTIYNGYAEDIEKNEKQFIECSSLFQVNKPIYVYSSIGSVKSNKTSCLFDLRFSGQSIGKIEANKEQDFVHLSVSEDQANYAKEKFGFTNSVALKGVEWKTSKEAIEFRKFYYSQKSTQNVCVKSKEHRIENYLLSEFGKTLRSQNKKLCNIQPIKLGKRFFQLTTPLKGSTHNPIISLTKNKNGATGGGIDILARVRNAKNESRVTIIELKDENRESESQELAMSQALIYATFISKLLRSNSGQNWWQLFGNTGEINKDETIHLNVVTIMPEGQSTEGNLDSIEVEDCNVTLHLFTLYYSEDKDGNPEKFSGSLLDEIKK